MVVMSQKVGVVTGALGGMGMEISIGLAREGYEVVMVARDRERGEAAAEAVRSATGNPRVELSIADFASLASVRAAAEAIAAKHGRIHVLSHNAAVFSGARKTTADGHELMFGVNHLAPFLFTLTLRPALRGGARVVFNTGEWKNKMNFDDLDSETSFKAFDAFGRSKSAQNLVAAELARRCAGEAILSNAVHPGVVKSTLVREAPLPLRLMFAVIGQTRHQGAQWPLRLATSPDLDGVTGSFFVKSKKQDYPEPARDADACARLWKVSERLVGIA
jgi:NAD(P)-dependent dehydrogenase (short-subunit alcohol dehydrogenase family)